MKGVFPMGGFISLIVAFIPMIIFILFLIFGIHFALRLERRSEQRLKIDKKTHLCCSNKFAKLTTV